jgi:bifunctional non-homologous end joining protein LigD
VLVGPDGRCDFSGLRSVLPKGRGYSVALVVFDLLFADGDDLRTLRLPSDGSGSSTWCRATGHIQLSELFEWGAGLYAKACELGLEGVVSKRAASTYRGARVSDWLKAKNPLYRRER